MSEQYTPREQQLIQAESTILDALQQGSRYDGTSNGILALNTLIQSARIDSQNDLQVRLQARCAQVDLLYRAVPVDTEHLVPYFYSAVDYASRLSEMGTLIRLYTLAESLPTLNPGACDRLEAAAKEIAFMGYDYLASAPNEQQLLQNHLDTFLANHEDDTHLDSLIRTHAQLNAAQVTFARGALQQSAHHAKEAYIEGTYDPDHFDIKSLTRALILFTNSLHRSRMPQIEIDQLLHELQDAVAYLSYEPAFHVIPFAFLESTRNGTSSNNYHPQLTGIEAWVEVLSNLGTHGESSLTTKSLVEFEIAKSLLNQKASFSIGSFERWRRRAYSKAVMAEDLDLMLEITRLDINPDQNQFGVRA